jgi:hypothetical protein
VPDGILPAEGIVEQLYYILGAPIPGVLPWRFMLFKNDVTPDADTVLADLEEASFPGYFPFDLTRSTWTMPTVVGGCAIATWGEEVVEWPVTGETDETIYGMAYYDSTENIIRWVQRFDDDDIVPLSIGQTFRVLPVYTLTSAACEGL